MSKKIPWTTEDIPDQGGKSVIVTGANSGIGFETARFLALHGATVIMACRNLEKGQAAADQIRSQNPRGQVILQRLDLADLASVGQFAENYLAEFDRLDILINNAGVMVPPYQRTADGFELQFGTNHLGHFKLTGLLIDMLQSTPDARVVTVSSGLHIFGRINFQVLNSQRSYQKMLAYCQSKLANVLFGYELQRRAAGSGGFPISIVVHPGFAATNVQRYNPLFRMLNPILAQSQAMGALPSLYAATSPEIHGGEYIGPDRFFGQHGYPRLVRSSPRSYDQDLARQLWEISEELTGIRFNK